MLWIYSVTLASFVLLNIFLSYKSEKGLKDEFDLQIFSAMKRISSLEDQIKFLNETFGKSGEMWAGFASRYDNRKLKKWDALLDYLKVEWRKTEATEGYKAKSKEEILYPMQSIRSKPFAFPTHKKKAERPKKK